MSDDSAFAIIENARRIWAIGSIHGEADKLAALHERLFSRLAPGDRLIYLGNYLGYGPAIIETVDEILSFRRKFLARPPFTDANDLILLRGSQEEMWQRILQLQFAVDPIKVVAWMAERGLASTLAAYAGESPQEILGQRAGPLTIAQWTGSVRSAMQERPGHTPFMSALKRAAICRGNGLLFVNAGVDISRPVEEQSDGFWWAGRSFSDIDTPYGEFTKIVRGFDPDHEGFNATEFTVTVDGGCGFDGPLIAVGFAGNGEIFEQLEA